MEKNKYYTSLVNKIIKDDLYEYNNWFFHAKINLSQNLPLKNKFLEYISEDCSVETFEEIENMLTKNKKSVNVHKNKKIKLLNSLKQNLEIQQSIGEKIEISWWNKNYSYGSYNDSVWFIPWKSRRKSFSDSDEREEFEEEHFERNSYKNDIINEFKTTRRISSEERDEWNENYHTKDAIINVFADNRTTIKEKTQDNETILYDEYFSEDETSSGDVKKVSSSWQSVIHSSSKNVKGVSETTSIIESWEFENWETVVRQTKDVIWDKVIWITENNEEFEILEQDEDNANKVLLSDNSTKRKKVKKRNSNSEIMEFDWISDDDSGVIIQEEHEENNDEDEEEDLEILNNKKKKKTSKKFKNWNRFLYWNFFSELAENEEDMGWYPMVWQPVGMIGGWIPWNQPFFSNWNSWNNPNWQENFDFWSWFWGWQSEESNFAFNNSSSNSQEGHHGDNMFDFDSLEETKELDIKTEENKPFEKIWDLRIDGISLEEKIGVIQETEEKDKKDFEKFNIKTDSFDIDLWTNSFDDFKKSISYKDKQEEKFLKWEIRPMFLILILWIIWALIYIIFFTENWALKEAMNILTNWFK